MTAATFSKDAREAATQARGSVALIDGGQVANLMTEHGVGVTQKRLRDNDYFEAA